MLKILRSPCDQCLFSKGKIVSDARRDDVLKQCQDSESHFVCHKFTIEELQGRLTPEEANVVCNGFYRHDPEGTTLLQIATRLGMIEWVDEPGAGTDD